MRGTGRLSQLTILTLDFVSGHDLRVVGLSPALGSMLNGESPWDSLSSPAPPPEHALALSQKK